MVLKTRIDESIKQKYKEENLNSSKNTMYHRYMNHNRLHERKNLDPFKKVNWKNIFDENYKGNYRYRKVDGKLV